MNNGLKTIQANPGILVQKSNTRIMMQGLFNTGILVNACGVRSFPAIRGARSLHADPGIMIQGLFELIM